MFTTLVYQKSVTNRLRERYVPVNISGRSKAQIVEDWEARNLIYLVVGTPHTELCRCAVCFQTKLNALMSHSEEATNGLSCNPVGDLSSDIV